MIQAVAPDIVVMPEVQEVAPFQRIAAALEMTPRLAKSRRRLSIRVGLLSRLPILDFRTLHLWPLWPSCLQATVQLANGLSLTVYGVHLAHFYAWFLEWWRRYQVRALLRHVWQGPSAHHLLAGDFEQHCSWRSSYVGGGAIMGQSADLVSARVHPTLGTQAAGRCRLCRLFPQVAPEGRGLYAPGASSTSAPRLCIRHAAVSRSLA